MEFRQIGDTEYSLIIEEKIRECEYANYCVGVSPDGKRFAAIVLREHLKDKELYENADIKIRWEAAHFRIIGMEKVFLELKFGSGERSLKFYINLYDPNFITIKDLWFSLIIETRMIAISDKGEPSIIATNVPIDVPKLVLEHIRKRKEEWKGA